MPFQSKERPSAGSTVREAPRSQPSPGSAGLSQSDAHAEALALLGQLASRNVPLAETEHSKEGWYKKIVHHRALTALVLALGVFALGGFIAYLSSLVGDRVSDRSAQSPTSPDLVSPATTAPPASLGGDTTPAPLPRQDAQSVKQAMADCDAAALASPDTLHLLVTPVTSTAGPVQFSMTAGEIYESFVLVPSQAMIDGLQNGSLAIEVRPFEFFIADQSGTHSWKSSAGQSSFALPNAAKISEFRIGFRTTWSSEIVWSNSYARRNGACYWINARLRFREGAPPPYSGFARQ